MPISTKATTRSQMGALLNLERDGVRHYNVSWLIVSSRVSFAAGESLKENLFLNMLLTICCHFCRQATGGSIPNVLPRLSDQELNVTQSVTNTGNVSHPDVLLPVVVY